MIQQGQVFKLKTKGAEAQPLWAYRYRLEGRGSSRLQVGVFASRAEAQKALNAATLLDLLKSLDGGMSSQDVAAHLREATEQ